jgi:(2Fe-2S) ferredoxin
MEASDKKYLAQRLDKVGIGKYNKHLLFCTGDSCGGKALEGQKSWDHLKKLLIDNQLTPGPVFRTRCHCLRVCTNGPIGVVYPEGVWYGNLTPANVERVVREHLMEGKVVEDLLLATNPLSCAP